MLVHRSSIASQSWQAVTQCRKHGGDVGRITLYGSVKLNISSLILITPVFFTSLRQGHIQHHEIIFFKLLDWENQNLFLLLSISHSEDKSYVLSIFKNSIASGLVCNMCQCDGWSFFIWRLNRHIVQDPGSILPVIRLVLEWSQRTPTVSM